MPRKKKVFLKLNVNDFMDDDKLIECSPATTGVYIKILCVLIKQEIQGKILLKQNAKQMVEQNELFAEPNAKQIVKQNIGFAYQLAKYVRFDFDAVLAAIDELVREDVVQIQGDTMIQKRMYNDGQLSLKRSIAGKKGVEAKRKLHEAAPPPEEMSEKDAYFAEVLLKQNVKQNDDFAEPFADVVADNLLRARVPKKDNNIITSFKEGGREGGEGIAKGGEKEPEKPKIIPVHFAAAKSEANVPQNEESAVPKFAMQKIYDKSFAELQEQKYSKHLTEEGFRRWQKFVEFVYANGYHELFRCHFVKPTDFQTLYNQPEIGFKEDMWKPVIVRILSYGIKPEFNLYFKLADFIAGLRKKGSPANIKKYLDIKDMDYDNMRTG